MTVETGSEINETEDEVHFVLSRARHVDPTCRPEAIRGFVREIGEAGAVLDAVDVDDVPLCASFSASWQGEARR